MAAGVHNIRIEQGATFYMLLTLKDSDGAAVDLTGHTFSGKVRSTVSSASSLLEFDFTVLTQSGETLGQVEVVVPANETTALVLDASTEADRVITYACYDIESVDAESFVKRWLEGTVELSPEATKT
jgi:hypothetical protein